MPRSLWLVVAATKQQIKTTPAEVANSKPVNPGDSTVQAGDAKSSTNSDNTDKAAEESAAVKLQARVRGRQARKQMEAETEENTKAEGDKGGEGKEAEDQEETA